jgi:hypothetical protein
VVRGGVRPPTTLASLRSAVWNEWLWGGCVPQRRWRRFAPRCRR